MNEDGILMETGGVNVRVYLHSGPGPLAANVIDSGDGTYSVRISVQVSGDYMVACAIDACQVFSEMFCAFSCLLHCLCHSCQVRWLYLPSTTNFGKLVFI